MRSRAGDHVEAARDSLGKAPILGGAHASNVTTARELPERHDARALRTALAQELVQGGERDCIMQGGIGQRRVEGVREHGRALP